MLGRGGRGGGGGGGGGGEEMGSGFIVLYLCRRKPKNNCPHLLIIAILEH